MPKTHKTNPTRMHKDFEKFVACLKNTNENEKQALSIFNKLVKSYDLDEFKSLCDSKIFSYNVETDSGAADTIHCNIIVVIVYRNYKQLLQQCLYIGVEVNGVVNCVNAELNNISTLFIASDGLPEPDLELLSIVLSAPEIDLLAIDYNNNFALMSLVEFTAPFKLFINAAIKQNEIIPLLTQENNRTETILNRLATQGKTGLLKELLLLPKCLPSVNAKSLLHDLRVTAWNRPDLTDEIESVCVILRNLLKQKPPMQVNKYSPEQRYEYLFGTKHDENPRTEGLKIILAQFSAMLSSVNPCFKTFKIYK